MPASPADKPVYRSNSLDMDNFGRVAKIFIDPKANEGYVADGYLNKRVAVIDLDSGKIKRIWGAYGEPPTDDDPRTVRSDRAAAAQQFRNPMHCAEMSNDGMVYVCDRPNDRVQMFTREGKFVKEVFVEPKERAPTARCGTSRSRRIPQQRTSTWPTAPTSTCACSTARR